MQEAVREQLAQANAAFFSPRSLRIELLKNCPEAIPTLAQWLYQEWHAYDRSLTQEKLIESLQKRLNSDRIPIAFVVLKGAEPVGVISIKECSDPEFADFPKESLWVGSLQVSLQERNKGLGALLLAFAAALAKELGHGEIYFYTSNLKNADWYVKRGALILEKRLFRNHEIAVMRIPLTEKSAL